jgi:hypothetical protein
VLHYSAQVTLASEKHCSLLGLFKTNKENDVLCKRYVVLCSQHLIFFVPYECCNKLVLHYTVHENLVRDNTLAYWAYLRVIIKGKEVFCIRHLVQHLQQFIFFVPYECRNMLVLHYTVPENLVGETL